MSERLLTLDAWAERIYGEAAPCPVTLRRWARNGNISPMPVKHGRAYFVRENAQYVSLTEGHRAPLVSRIRRDPAEKKRA